MMEALIVINLMVGASFLSLSTWLVYLRIRRERLEMEIHESAYIEPAHFVADILGEEVN